MILLCGIPSEPPLAKVARALDALGAPFLFFNQRHFSTTHLAFQVASGQCTGALTLSGQRVDLGAITAVYTRLMDEQHLVEYRAIPPGGPERERCHRLHDALNRWIEIAPARVVNRGRPMASNASKPYQAQLIARNGLRVPETLITNDPEIVREFLAQHERVIYKSASGVRSIVQDFAEADLARLESIRWCPVQFQEYVPGTNVRVHVVGQKVIATRIDTDVTDYRYAGRQGGESRLTATTLADQENDRCISLARDLELPFAGIDLKITPEGEVYCFEVNPSPGFSYFEESTGQPIAHELALHLLGVNDTCAPTASAMAEGPVCSAGLD